MEMDRAQCSQMLRRRRRFKQLILLALPNEKNHIYILNLICCIGVVKFM